jgi:hypothetical protein
VFPPPTLPGAVLAPASVPSGGDEPLIRKIEEAIRAGRVVSVGEVTIRYCKRGQEFVEEEQHFRALTSGVFLRMNVFEGRTADLTARARTTWGYYAPLDELAIAMKVPLAKLTPEERAALTVDLNRQSGFEPKPAL